MKGLFFVCISVYGILCHYSVFSGSCLIVRDLFEQRLLCKQPQHPILPEKMLHDALTEEKPRPEMKGCTSDQVFSRRRCDNECYDEKKKFGGTNYYMCVHCCIGDNCNSDSSGSAGFQMKIGIILTFASTALALVKYL